MSKLSILLLSICLISLGCSKEENKKHDTIISKTETPWSGFNLYTVKHDGHLFIVWGRSDKVILHHPDCPCKSKN